MKMMNGILEWMHKRYQLIFCSDNHWGLGGIRIVCVNDRRPISPNIADSNGWKNVDRECDLQVFPTADEIIRSEFIEAIGSMLHYGYCLVMGILPLSMKKRLDRNKMGRVPIAVANILK